MHRHKQQAQLGIEALTGAGIDPSKISNLKCEQCKQLASLLVKNNVSIDSSEYKMMDGTRTMKNGIARMVDKKE